MHEHLPARWPGCHEHYVSGRGRFNWKEMRQKMCFTQTPWGNVSVYDGELILDNPKFVRTSGAVFSLDTSGEQVVLDDLL